MCGLGDTHFFWVSVSPLLHKPRDVVICYLPFDTLRRFLLCSALSSSSTLSAPNACGGLKNVFLASCPEWELRDGGGWYTVPWLAKLLSSVPDSNPAKFPHRGLQDATEVERLWDLGWPLTLSKTYFYLMWMGVCWPVCLCIVPCLHVCALRMCIVPWSSFNPLLTIELLLP